MPRSPSNRSPSKAVAAGTGRTRTAETGFLVDYRYLAGVAELAELFQVRRQAVSNWNERRARIGFPAPKFYLAMGPVWDVTEVVRWYDRYVPSRGGRPGTAPRNEAGRYVPA